MFSRDISLPFRCGRWESLYESGCSGAIGPSPARSGAGSPVKSSFSPRQAVETMKAVMLCCAPLVERHLLYNIPVLWFQDPRFLSAGSVEVSLGCQLRALSASAVVRCCVCLGSLHIPSPVAQTASLPPLYTLPSCPIAPKRYLLAARLCMPTKPQPVPFKHLDTDG